MQDNFVNHTMKAEELANLERILAPFRVGLLHGRLKGRQRDETMAAFVANTL